MDGTVVTESMPHNAGRIAAQTAKQVVMQRLREAEREIVFMEYEDKEGEVFAVNIQRVEPKQVIVVLGRAEAVMPLREMPRTMQRMLRRLVTWFMPTGWATAMKPAGMGIGTGAGDLL